MSNSDHTTPSEIPAHPHTGAPAHHPAHPRTGKPVNRFFSNAAAVAYKEARVIRHDRALLVAVFTQPIMMLMLFGLALSNKPANVEWAVLDRSQSAVARRFVLEVESTGYFLPPVHVGGMDEGRRLLKRGKAVAFVVIPPEFRRDVERGRPEVQVLLDGTDPITAARVGGYIAQVGAVFETRRAPAAPTDPSQPSLRLRQQFRFNPTLADREFFLAAFAGMLLTNICLSVTSLGLVGERESGTYEHMLSSPTTPTEIVLGKLAPYVVLSYVVLLFSVFACGLVFGIWPQGSWLALLLVTLPFVLASLGMGVFVSALANTSAQAVFISVFFILPSFVLSGAMFPFQLMPPGVREVGYLLPLRWYQIASRRVIERGAGLAEIALPTIALTGMFLVILLLIRWRMKPRLG